MLKNYIGFLVVTLALQSSFGQTIDEPNLPRENPVYLTGFDYPDFDSVSNTAWFRLYFPLGNSTEIGFGADHFRSFAADRLNVPIELRQYITKKAYLLGGFQWEWDLMNENKGYPNPTPRRETFMGVGYELRPNWFLEAKLVSPMGKPQFEKFGLEGVKTRWEFGTRLKF